MGAFSGVETTKKFDPILFNLIRKSDKPWFTGDTDLNSVLDGEASDGVAAGNAMGDGEFGEGIVSPEASRERVADNVVQFPRGNEGSCEHLPLGGDGVPETADAAGTGEIGYRKVLEDEAEDVGGGECREMGIHGGDHCGGSGGGGGGGGG